MKISPSIFRTNPAKKPMDSPLVRESMMRLESGIRSSLGVMLLNRYGQDKYDHESRQIDDQFYKQLELIVSVHLQKAFGTIDVAISTAWAEADKDAQQLKEGTLERRRSEIEDSGDY